MPDITQNIIMQIGSRMGPGGLASLQSGIQMISGLAGGIVSAVRKIDAFSEATSRANMSMVSYARTASEGQIQTVQLAQGWNQAVKLGLEPTRAQFETMAKAATEFADSVGGDANAEFRNLVSAISMGRERGLKPFGIELKAGATLAEKQASALEQLSAQYGKTTIEVDTATDAVTKLKNEWDTLIGTLGSKAGAVGVFKNIISAVSGFGSAIGMLNEQLVTGGRNVNDYLFSLQGVIDWLHDKLTGDDVFTYMIGVKTEKDRKQDITDRTNYLSNYYKTGEDPEYRFKKRPTIGLPEETKKKTGGSKRSFSTTGDDVDALKRLGDSDYADAVQQWAEMSGKRFESIEEIIAAEEAYRNIKMTAPGMDLGDAGFWNDRLSAQQQRNFEGTSESVDAQLEALQKLEDQRDKEFSAWTYRWMEEKRRQDEQLTFAEDWAAAWKKSLGEVSAGTMAAQAAHDLLRGTWNATIDAAITGQGNLSHAVRTTIADIGLSVAKEAGWQAVLNAAYAIMAAAKRDYGAAAKYTAAAVAFGALAGTASVAAHALQPKKGTAQSADLVSSTSREYGTTYPSGGMSEKTQPVNVNVYLEGDAKGVFNIVKTEEARQQRSGQAA